MAYCYFNGDILPYEDCRVHISDLQIQRGYGVFDYFRIRDGEIPWLEDYFDRLFNSVHLAGIPCELARLDFRQIIDELREKNSDELAAFKILVSGGYSETLDSAADQSNVIVLQLPWVAPPREGQEEGVSLVTDEFIRPNPEVKSLYYFNSMRLREKMQRFKAAEVLYHQELVTECSRSSIFFVKEGQVFTTENNVLQGITRKQVLRLFPEAGLQDLPFSQLYDMDEIFITSTTRDVTPVVSIDGRKIASGKPGKITGEIQARFKKLL